MLTTNSKYLKCHTLREMKKPPIFKICDILNLCDMFYYSCGSSSNSQGGHWNCCWKGYQDLSLLHFNGGLLGPFLSHRSAWKEYIWKQIQKLVMFGKYIRIVMPQLDFDGTREIGDKLFETNSVDSSKIVNCSQFSVLYGWAFPSSEENRQRWSSTIVYCVVNY